jgi:hypothetical protein
MTTPEKCASIVIHSDKCEIVPALKSGEIRVFQNVLELLDYVGKTGIQITLIEYAVPSAKKEADLIASRIVGYHVMVGAGGGAAEVARRVDFSDAQAEKRYEYSREVRYDPIRKHAVLVLSRVQVVSAMYVTGERKYADAHRDFWAKQVDKEDIRLIDLRLHLLAENAELRRRIAELEKSGY